MLTTRRTMLLRMLLGLVVLAGLSFWGADAHDRNLLFLHPDGITGDPFKIDNDLRVVTLARPEAERAGLAKGDVIDTLNGERYTGEAQLARVGKAKPGETLAVGFHRADGSRGTARIALRRVALEPGAPRNRGEWWQQFALFGIMPLLCMLIGYWVVFARPTEPNAWLLLILLIFPEVVFGLATGLATGGWLLFRGLYYQVLQITGPLILLPFAIYFPERSRIDVKLPWLKWAVLVPAGLCGVSDLRQMFGQFYLGGNPGWLIALARQSDRLENALNLLCVVLYLVILTDKLRSASTQDARRRLRVLLAGTGTGLFALLFAFVLLPDLGFSPVKSGQFWVPYAGAGLFLLAPLTLAYVVLVQRAMDVRILIRQGTRYALAKATLWGVQVLLVGVVLYRLLLPLLTGRRTAREELVPAVFFLLLLALLRFVFSRGSRNWLDRRFFREAYDSERVLSELSLEVRQFTESEPLLQTVARRVAETLHVSQIGMLLGGGGTFILARAVGVAAGGAVTLPMESATIRNLASTNAPARLYRGDPEDWYLEADAAERRALDVLGAELLLPLPGRNRLMGVMALGPKQSEAAYSRADLHLLQMLATQTGMALEVSELAHSLAGEAALRERAQREMEIAREVQERLFPQAMPVLAWGSVAGACRAALGVGGDYYDVFWMEDGRLGLAIGDVSGKGFPAALLMAGLRASLRGVTIDNPGNFAKMMEKINRLVYEASASNRYATFFFGALDPATRVLECVNAGHNAPLVLRRDSAGQTATVRIEADGPVVGLLPAASYSEQKIQLEPDDLLLCYTDGISEAMTDDDEEWGEERMMAAAGEDPEASAKQVLETIFAEADRFTSGAPQHDDMTMLVLRLDCG